MRRLVVSAPVLQKLTASLSAQTAIKLPKKSTPKQDVQLGKEAGRTSASNPIIEDQHVAKYLTQIGNRLVAAAPTELK